MASITNDKGSVSFPCPQCGKSTIVRSRNDRENVVAYACSECGFRGPN